MLQSPTHNIIYIIHFQVSQGCQIPFNFHPLSVLEDDHTGLFADQEMPFEILGQQYQRTEWTANLTYHGNHEVEARWKYQSLEALSVPMPSATNVSVSNFIAWHYQNYLQLSVTVDFVLMALTHKRGDITLYPSVTNAKTTCYNFTQFSEI